jgi:hypothetical protein
MWPSSKGLILAILFKLNPGPNEADLNKMSLYRVAMIRKALWSLLSDNNIHQKIFIYNIDTTRKYALKNISPQGPGQSFELHGSSDPTEALCCWFC